MTSKQLEPMTWHEFHRRLKILAGEIRQNLEDVEGTMLSVYPQNQNARIILGFLVMTTEIPLMEMNGDSYADIILSDQRPDDDAAAPVCYRWMSSHDFSGYPWQKKAEQPVEEAITTILQEIGENPERDGLKATPSRVRRFYQEFMNPEPFTFTRFDGEHYGGDSLVTVKDIPFYSLCEHHMIPFFGVAHIAYVPQEQILGLSKLPRLLDKHARRLQNQERITREVMLELLHESGGSGAICYIEAEHLCMSMRGIQKPGTKTVTMNHSGLSPEQVREFLTFIGK